MPDSGVCPDGRADGMKVFDGYLEHSSDLRRRGNPISIAPCSGVRTFICVVAVRRVRVEAITGSRGTAVTQSGQGDDLSERRDAGVGLGQMWN